MASVPSVPVSSSTTPAATDPSSLAPPPSKVRAFLARCSDTWNHALSQSRPWRDLTDLSSFSKPDSISEAGSRIRKNLTHFRLNYSLLFSAILALTLITHPFSLLLLGALFSAWVFAYLIRTTPLTLFNRTYSEREVLIILSVLSIVVIFMTSVGSVLISAAMLGCVVICLHGAFHVPDDLFLDEIPSSSGSLLPFLTTGTLPASAVSAVV